MLARDNVKVMFASLAGIGAPASNWFLDTAEPMLRVLLLAAQLAVAIVTALYVYSKWKKNRKE
jgi:hypothetical protein